ncbi:uncharacterized protein LOC131932326 [Physella acuta]|uniref:uncharacterized protein LOC131932326 n=1 Tax=Physella acuta TaxID=109671 RepID=UPI0027DDD120|nr:uncharacterized protein LOC131932326 [Physella acuta]
MIPSVTFATIIACTTITGIQLKHVGALRKSISTRNNISTKEKKLVIMLVIVSVIFIACLMPTAATRTAVGIMPELSVNGNYFDVGLLLYELSYLTETLTSSVNLLVYYSMSSRYKYTIRSMFKLKL